MTSTRRTGATLAVIGASIGLGLLVWSVDLTTLLFGTTLLLVIVAWARASWRDFLSPLVPLALAVATSGFLPALLGYYDETRVMGISGSDYQRAGFGSLMFIGLALAVFLHKLPRSATRRAQPSIDPSQLMFNRALGLWLVLFCCGIAAGRYAVLTAGGAAGYLGDLTSRRVAFEGQAWIAWLQIAPSAASLVVVAALRRRGRRSVPPVRRLAIAGVVAGSLALLLLTGNRMNLVAYAASLAVTVHLTGRRIGFAKVAVGVVAMAAVALALPGWLRSGEAGSFQARTLADSYRDLDRSGPISDFGQVAGMAMIMAPDKDAPIMYGTTYLAAGTMFVPRAIAPWKLPDAGQVATEHLLPRYWNNAGTGMQIGAVGEAYLNLRWVGIGLAGLVAGFGLRWLHRARVGGTFGALAYAVALPRAALYFRGGFATVTTFFLMELLVVIVVFRLARRESVAVPASPNPPPVAHDAPASFGIL